MSIFNENNLTEDAEFFMMTPEFATNQVFGSCEELMDWVQNMAHSLGVVIVKKRSNKKPCGFVYKVVLMCDRGGDYKVKDSSRVSGTKKSNCPFELEGKYLDEYDSWTLRVICDGHNHQPAQYMEEHPYAKRLSEDEYSLVAELTTMNVAPRDILSILKERNVNNVSTLKTIYNARNKIRMVEQVGKSPMQMPVHANLLNVQVPSIINNNSSYVAMDGVANGALSLAESLVHSSKKLEDELLLLGKNIKHHEDNINLLKTCINNLDDQITDLQVTLGNNHSSITPMIEDKDLSRSPSGQATVEQITQYEKSAAGIVCQMKYRGNHSDLTFSTNDVLGVVATIGKVNDDNLSRLLSEYLGLDTMLALVCMKYNDVEALEAYDKEGFGSKSDGLHGIGASIGRTLDGRFNVICLENLRPYVGEFIPDDPQRRLALLKPKLPNGESPHGFLGFAVNMIHVDIAHLFSLTSDGHGIRETLFYTLLSRLQVYETRANMFQALPFLSDGAISLDGGIIRSNGVFVFGTREEIDVRFATGSYVPENLVDIENKMKELKLKKETMVEEVAREEAILAHIKYTFQVKKQEFVRFMAQNAPYVMQYPVQATPRRSTPR